MFIIMYVVFGKGILFFGKGDFLKFKNISRFWWDGPDAVKDFYREELKRKKH